MVEKKARFLLEPCGFGDPNERWDIYASALNDDGSFGTAVRVDELSSGYRDTRTAIRNDGLELFLTSSRPGGFGALDLWVSMRETTTTPWSVPVNLGPAINTASREGAPALSCDGTTLYFYSNRPGGLDSTISTCARAPSSVMTKTTTTTEVEEDITLVRRSRRATGSGRV